ncbi:MAG: glutamine synthetase [Solirubrobacteraceae bacterium]
MSPPELVSLLTCDLGSIARGRAVFASELQEHLQAGIGWVPANQALTPLGPLAEPNPFGPIGDLRLLPDPGTHVRVGGEPGASPLELILCDIVETDGTPWACCPRSFLKDALLALGEQAEATLTASFEHEFQLLRGGPSEPPFSLAAQRGAEPFATAVMGSLVEAGVEPERFFPEFASHQFEIPVAPANGLASADRSVVLRAVVQEAARREGLRASFVPLLDPSEAGNGLHIHLSLHDRNGRALLYDAARPGRLSELGGSFAAGILSHAGALSALCAPSPVSGERLRPHHWSAGSVSLGAQNRESLLRIPPLVDLGGGEVESQMRLEFRGADAAANPYLALGAILRAGLEGIRGELPAPPILDRDPAELDEAEAARFGVGGLPGSLGEALEALEADRTAKGWLTPLLGQAYVSLKRAELAATADMTLEEACRRYADVY